MRGLDGLIQLGEGFGGGYLAGMADVHYADKAIGGVPPSGIGAIGLGLLGMTMPGAIGHHSMQLAAGMAGGAGYRAGSWGAANTQAAQAAVAGRRSPRQMAQDTGARPVRGPIQAQEVEAALAALD